jgi:Disulfide bond formation protein DsbB
MTTADGRMLLGAAGSGLLLLGALAFQHLGGLAPCEMCLWQRWPHVAALALAVAAIATASRGSHVLRGLGLVAMLVSAGLALLHVGVEQGWWDGPSTCAVGQGADLTTDQLLDQIVNAPAGALHRR